ncbi:hypothetical protein UlMin_022821 [Ulmus minor]
MEDLERINEDKYWHYNSLIGFSFQSSNFLYLCEQALHNCHAGVALFKTQEIEYIKRIELLQLRLQQEKSKRLMLERAMGRASSTLSPGHRHFAAQTTELIAEIESLEEEVTNREQQVLSLYRNVFEHCVSRTPCEQNSSVASPCHFKLFSSSRKFPLRPLQALVSIDDSGKELPRLIMLICSALKKSFMMRTLKDHLHQCPSKLSEEMVRCMVFVYCWLRSAASVNSEKKRSPFLSRSSTNVIQPRRGIGEDPDWSEKSMVEILWISTKKSQFSQASCAINNYRVLVEQLERMNLGQMEPNAQTAFWINVHNALVMHAYLVYGIYHNSLRRLAFFHKAAYNIGGHVISANAIEQSIFGFQSTRNGWVLTLFSLKNQNQILDFSLKYYTILILAHFICFCFLWLETILAATLRRKSGEDRQISSKLGLANSDPLICFALCTGAFSDPALRVYTASNLREEVEVAKREFLQSNVLVKKSILCNSFIGSNFIFVAGIGILRSPSRLMMKILLYYFLILC